MAQAAAKKLRDIEADWDRQAVLSAISAAKAVISGDGINGRAMISSLSEIEWGWIASAIICGWIQTKAQQASQEGIGYDVPIRTFIARNPEPWEAGAIATILPALGDLEGVDWSKPVGEWSKDAIISFAWQMHRLVSSALAARDEGSSDKIVRKLTKETEREISALHGGPLLARSEMDDDIPF